jgi:hypothetical protein
MVSPLTVRSCEKLASGANEMAEFWALRRSAPALSSSLKKPLVGHAQSP